MNPFTTPDFSKYLSRFSDLEDAERKKTETLASGENRYQMPKTLGDMEEIVSGANKFGGLTLGGYKDPLDAETYKTKNKPDPKKAKDGINFGGVFGEKGDVSGGVMSGLSGIQGLTQQFSTTAGSDEEALMGGLKTTFDLTKTGFQLGGPIGAGVGAAVGLTTTAIDVVGDRKKRWKNAVAEQDEALRKKSETRARNWHLDKSQSEIAALQSIHNNSLHHIDTSRYNYG